jgi:hypothetical protein
VPGKTLVWVIYAGPVYLACPDDAELQRTRGHMVFPDERVAVVVLTCNKARSTVRSLPTTRTVFCAFNKGARNGLRKPRE